MTHDRGAEAAVSDVVGAILLVGITVVMAAGFGLLLLNYDGPADAQNSRVVVSVMPGTGGWGTGDEQLRVTHLGGEPLDRDAVTIRLTRGGTTTTYDGSGLLADVGTAFDDGELTTGEVWALQITAALNDELRVGVGIEGEASQLLTGATVIAGATSTTLCLDDTTPPTASLSASPSDVTSLTSGAVSVTAVVADACSDVDDTVVPHLYWCVAVTCTQPADYTDAGVMTSTGAHQWSANVPARTWLTDAANGRTLRYFVGPMGDDAGNRGNSTVASDTVDLMATYTYVASGYASTGTLQDLGNAQAPPTNSAVATLAEGGTFVAAGTGGPTKFSGTTATPSAGVTSANLALASDNSRVVLDANSEFVEVTGFDLPSNANTITALFVGFEGQRPSGGGSGPTYTVEYKTSSTAYSVVATGTAGTTETDAGGLVTGQTVAGVESMTVKVSKSSGSRNLEVDHVFVQVTYTTSAQTQYSLAAQLNFTGVPSAPSGIMNLELRQSVSGDTFNVQVWNFTTSAWRTCSGTLASATAATYSCSLSTAHEASGGVVRARLTDVTPTGTTQGIVSLDYARVATA